MSESNTHLLEHVKTRIQKACQNTHRYPQDILLLAVSKTRASKEIESLYQQGIHSFGENYYQEALSKIKALEHLNIDWHFIGPIQSNKTQGIAEHFAWVHSVDRFKIAKRLAAQRPQSLPALNICIQINIDQETSKSGLLPEDLLSFLESCKALQNLQVRGLMCLPKAGQDPSYAFAKMQNLLKKAQAAGHPLDNLSMGMSSDYEKAIEHGATIIRLGTALFGKRT